MKLSTMQVEWVDWAMQRYDDSNGGWDNDEELISTFVRCICVALAAGRDLENEVNIDDAVDVFESFQERQADMEYMMDQVLRHKLDKSYEAVLSQSDGFKEIRDSINPFGFDTKVSGA